MKLIISLSSSKVGHFVDQFLLQIELNFIFVRFKQWIGKYHLENMNLTTCQEFSIESILKLTREFSITHFSIAPLALIFNIWFIKYLLNQVLMNRNLNILLILHCILACIISTHGLVSSIAYIFIEPCSMVTSQYFAKIINTPRTLSFTLMSFVLIMISFERTYATYRYLTYGNDQKYRFSIWLVIGLTCLPVFILHALAVQSLISNPQLTLAMASALSGQTLSIIGGFLSLSIITLCTIVLLVNKLWNRHKLRNYDWFNRGKFYLKSRIQLSQNIDTNQSIFWMTLLFLFTFLIASSIMTLLSSFDVSNNLHNVDRIFYAILVQQLYCFLYIFVYVGSSEKMRKKRNLLKKKPKLSIFFLVKIENLFKKQSKVLPVNRALDQAKDRYFQELGNMWN